MNAIRIIALSVLLASGGALAAGKKKGQELPPDAPKPLFTEADRPKTCADQCKVLEKVMTEPCKKNATKKQAQQMCTTQSKQMVDACNNSCKDKGRVDKQYIMERIKPPAGYKAGQDGAKGKSQEKDDAH